MKKYAGFLILALGLLAGCGNSKSKSDPSLTDKEEIEKKESGTDELKNAAVDMEKIKDELGNLPPLTNEQLKALVPEQLLNGERSDLEITSTMGASVASARYKINDSADVTLNIIDCAGPGGAGIYNIQYMSMFGFEEEDEDEYTKTIEFKGNKAFEHCRKDRNNCTLTYFSGGRFLVSLEGDNVGIEGIKSAASSLKLK